MTDGFAETAWDRVSAVWRVEVDSVPVLDDEGEARVFWSFTDASDFAHAFNRAAWQKGLSSRASEADG